MSKISRIVFFCRIADPELLELLDFYREDIALAHELADEVVVCTSMKQLRGQTGVLWAWWHAPSMPAVLAWRALGRPSVVTGAVDLSNPTETGPKHVMKRWLTWASARAATLNLAISEYEARDLRSLSGGARIATLFPCVDTAFLQPGEPAAAPTFLTVAQVNPNSIHRKGLDRVVDLFASVRADLPSARLTIAGPTDAAGQAWIDGLQAAGRLGGITFAGKVTRERKRELMQQSWYYLQPSRYEGFGLAVAEAMACGAIPIVTGVGSLPEVVGDAGRVIDWPGSPGSLAPPTALERARARTQAERFSAGQRRTAARVSLREAGLLPAD